MKNKVSAWRNYFARRKGKNPTAARNNKKMCNTHLALNLEGDKR